MSAELALKARLTDQGILDRFESRAIEWAEKSGIRWIEIEGELWTLVSELERKKGVEPSDFQRQAALTEAPYEKGRQPSRALQRLLQVPGVRRASIPTSFEVEGGWALSCGGPGAKEGITAMVRRQVPEWALAGYTLVNLPLALSYLMHGRTEVAKATRDLTITTTTDMGKAAAERGNASMAVMQLSNDVNPAFRVLFNQMMALMANDNATTKTIATNANQKADHAIKIARMAMDQNAKARPPKPARPTDATRKLLFDTWGKHYQGICPCCYSHVDRQNMQVEHWTSRHLADVANLWVTCAGCNTRMGRPAADGQNGRTDQDRKRFVSFQEMINRPDAVQTTLPIDLPHP